MILLRGFLDGVAASCSRFRGQGLGTERREWGWGEVQLIVLGEGKMVNCKKNCVVEGLMTVI